MKYIENALKQLDLSDNAIAIYLASYTLGRATIGTVAKELSMDRSSAYLAVRQLVEEGLLKEDLIDGKKHILANPPQTIEALLKTRASQFTASAQTIDEHLGELLNVYQEQNRRVRLETFSGRASLRKITQDILTSDAKEVRIFTNQNAERNVFSAKEHDEFIKKRIQKGMTARVLAADTKEAQLLIRYDERELRETRVSENLTPLKNETYLYGDTVAVLGFSEMIYGFIVKDQEYAQLQQLLFDHLWLSTK